jgi:prevent-host-death family protein
MKEMPLKEFRIKISETLGPVIYGGERVVLLNHGKKVAVVISHKEYESMIGIVREFDRMRELKEEGESIR